MGPPKKYCCNLCQKVFCLFSSKSFTVSGLMLGSLIHFEFIIVYGVRVEKAMALHSSALAWKIPWIEEPGGLQSMGSQRVKDTTD